MALSCSIFGTYYVLSNYSESIIFTIFFALLSINAIAFFLISCQLLFQVPNFVRARKELCGAMLHKAGNGFEPLDVEIRDRRLKAIPQIGCKDGSFRVLESEASLNFIDFYVNQVISLLLL